MTVNDLKLTPALIRFLVKENAYTKFIATVISNGSISSKTCLITHVNMAFVFSQTPNKEYWESLSDKFDFT